MIMSLPLAILPPHKKRQYNTLRLGHFHFAHIGHYHFAVTARPLKQQAEVKVKVEVEKKKKYLTDLSCSPLTFTFTSACCFTCSFIYKNPEQASHALECNGKIVRGPHFKQSVEDK